MSTLFIIPFIDDSETMQNQVLSSQDTCGATLVGKTEKVDETHPKENQPSGWIQLLLPVGITLFVVFLEKIVTRWYDKRDAKEHRKQYRDTVLDWIEKNNPTESTLSASVRLLSESILNSDLMQPVPFVMPLTLHDKLQDITVDKMTEAFLQDYSMEKDKRYPFMFDIISNFEFLSRIRERITETYDSYHKQAIGTYMAWNNFYIEFMGHFNSMPQNNPYSSTVYSWINELHSKPNSLAVHKKYMGIIASIVQKVSDFDTLAIVSKLNHMIVISEKERNDYAKVFTDIADNIDLALKSLLDAKDFFRVKK